jgi:hypothetical protein
MRRLLFLLLPLILLSLKCKKDPPPELQGTLVLNMKPIYNNSPLIINRVYDYNGKKVRFTKLSFFMSNIHFPYASVNGEERVYFALADFTSLDDSIKAIKGLDISNNILVRSNYVGVGLSIGVDRVSNAKKPKDFPSSSPFSDAGYYWDDWKSYIFSKLEGLMDKDGDGKFETGFTIHTGGDEVYKTVDFSKNFTIKEGEITTVNFELNLNKLLNGIDLTTVNSTHQTGDLPTMKLFMGNFKEALTIK